MNLSKVPVKLFLKEVINLILKLKAPSILSTMIMMMMMIVMMMMMMMMMMIMMMSMMTIMVNCFCEINDR